MSQFPKMDALRAMREKNYEDSLKKGREAIAQGIQNNADAEARKAARKAKKAKKK